MRLSSFRRITILTFFLACLFSGPVIFATSYTWTGTTSTAWNVGTNWSPNGVPGSGDNATIVSVTNQPVLDASHSVTDFTMTSGTLDLNTYTLTSTGISTFNGGTISNGTMSSTGSSATYAGTTFGAAVSANSSAILLNGSTFNSIASFTKTGGTNDNSSGNNTFGGTTSIVNNGTGFFLLGNTNGDTFNSNVTFSVSSSGHIYVSHASSTQFNGNITFNNTSTGYIFFCNNSGTATLASGKTLTIGGSGFTGGGLYLWNFTQVGSTSQILSLSSSTSLNIQNSSFNGKVNFTAGNWELNHNYFADSCIVEKTGGNTNDLTGGNKFNGPLVASNSGSGDFRFGNVYADTCMSNLVLTNTATGQLAFGLNAADNIVYGTTTITNANNSYVFIANTSGSSVTFGDDITVSNTSTGQIIFNQGGTVTYNGNIEVSNTSSGSIYLGVGSGGSSTLASGKTLTIGSGGYTGGMLKIGDFTQAGSTSQILSLSSSASLNIQNTVFNGKVNFTAGNWELDHNYFADSCIVEKTGGNTNDLTGGNKFNGPLVASNSGLGDFRFGNVYADTCMSNLVLTNTATGQLAFGLNAADNIVYGTTTITNANNSYVLIANTSGSSVTFGDDITVSNTSTGQIIFNQGGTVTYNGNIEVNNTSSGAIYLGYASTGTSSLASGKTISIGGSGFTNGLLEFHNFTQVGSTSQILSLSSSASLNIQNSSFNGKVNFTAGNWELDHNYFADSCIVEKTGGNTNDLTGGNKFNGPLVASNSGSGDFRFGNVYADTCMSNLVLTNTATGQLAFGLNAADNIVYGTTTITNANNSYVLIANTSGSSVTFGDDVIVSNASTGQIIFNQGGTVTYNGNIEVNNTSSGAIYLGYASTGRSSLASGKTISIGGGGFSGGLLELYNFTQLGTTAQSLTLTGSISELVLAHSTFNGPVDFTSPLIFLNGSTYNKKAEFNQTTTVYSSTGEGGNVFNDTCSITNSGLGYFMSGYFYNDTLNGKTFISNTSTGQVYMGYNADAFFNDNILLNQTTGGSIFFGGNTGICKLASGKTISTGASGVTDGYVELKNFIQLGSTAQTITFTGTSSGLGIGSGSTFNGNVTFTAPNIYLNGCTYNGTASITKNGSSNSTGLGGNIFNNTATITNSGSGYLVSAFTTADIFNGDVTFAKSGSGILYIACSGINEFYKNFTSNGDVTYGVSGGTISFKGSSAQTLAGDVTALFPILTINKPSNAVTLSTPVSVSNILNLTSGNIITSSTNLITMQNGTTLNGGSSASFVDGPFQKIGNSAFAFPVGKSTNYEPIGISAPSSTSDAFTAEYSRAAPPSFASNDGSLLSRSSCEYWTLSEDAGSSSVQVTLYWNTSTCTPVFTPALAVGRYFSSIWHSVGGENNIVDNNTSGTITSDPVSDFGVFTFGTVPCYAFSGDTLIDLTYPPNFFTTATLDTIHFRWHVNYVPALSMSTDTMHTVKLQVAPQIADTATGQLVPDWSRAVIDSVQYVPGINPLTTGNYNKLISDLLSQAGQDQDYFWRVGLQYKLPVSGIQPINWTDPFALRIGGAQKSIPAAYLAAGDTASSTHTNKINWVYEVTFLDENKTNQVITYVDGLGKTRQNQAFVSSKNHVLCTETAYSEEGGNPVQSMAGPTGDSLLGYSVRFFDVDSSGVQMDFMTRHFDREIKGTTYNALISPAKVDTTAGIGNYYRNTSAFESYVDDAKGYPYAYTVNYKDPLNRPMLAGGVGETFRITGGKEVQSFITSPSYDELKRVYGKSKADSLSNISKTVVVDPNGVGSITYMDDDGKVIATALSTCSAVTYNQDTLNEDGMKGFTSTYNILKNDKLNNDNLGLASSSNFYLSCASNPVSIHYQIDQGTFATGASSCKNCDYDLVIRIVEDVTEYPAFEHTERLPHDTTQMGCSDMPVTFDYDTSITLPRAGTYTVYRTIVPHVNKQGRSVVEQAIYDYTQDIYTSASTNRNAFAAEYYGKDEWYMLRKTLGNDRTATDFKRCLTTYAGVDGDASVVDSTLAYARMGDDLYAIDIDSSNNIYFACIHSSASLLRKITPEGKVSTIKNFTGLGYGIEDIAVDNKGNVYFTDDQTSGKIRKINGAGTITDIYSGKTHKKAIEYSKGYLYFTRASDTLVSTRTNITKIDVSGNVIVDGFLPKSSELPYNIASSSTLSLVVNSSFSTTSLVKEDIYTLSTSNVKVYKISYNGTSGSYTTFAGSGSSGNANGAPSSASFVAPIGITSDKAGDIYVTDFYTIRKISASTGIVTTIAGTFGSTGSVDGRADSTTKFRQAWGIACDQQGNLFITDKNTIRKITNCGLLNVCHEVLPTASISFTNNPYTTLVLQPDAEKGKDAEITDRSAFVNTNFGSMNFFEATAWTWSGTPGLYRGLLQFDLSSVPSNAYIVDAKLSLYSKNGISDASAGSSTLSGSDACYLERITSAWLEDSVTWTNQPSTTSTNRATIPAAAFAYQSEVNIDVSALVSDMVANPSTSFGFMMKLQTEAHYRNMMLVSSDYADATVHPKLEVRYVLSPPTCTNLGSLSDYATVDLIIVPPDDTSASPVTIGQTTWNKGDYAEDFVSRMVASVNSNYASNNKGFIATNAKGTAYPAEYTNKISLTAKPGTGKTYNNWKVKTSISYTSGLDTNCFRVVPVGDVERKAATLNSTYPFTVSAASSPISFSPSSGLEDTVVAITGSGFNNIIGVLFNGKPAKSYTVNSSSSITAVVPYGPSTGPVTVVDTAGTITSFSNFVITGQTLPLNFTPNYGLADSIAGTPGTAVKIYGSDFSAVTNVKFNGVTAIYRATRDTIFTSVPFGATTGPVSVTFGGSPVTNVFKGGFNEGSCQEYLWYADQMDTANVLVGMSSKIRLSNLDGAGKIGLPAGDSIYSEAYIVNGFNSPSASDAATRYDFLSAYERMHWVRLKDADITSMNTYTVTGGLSSVPDLLENRILDTTDLQDYKLIRIKYKGPTCEDKCVAREFPVDCSNSCDEKYKSLNADLFQAYDTISNDFDAMHTLYQYPDTTNTLHTLKWLVDNRFPFSYNQQAKIDSVRPDAMNLYMSYESAVRALQFFDKTECMRTCNNDVDGNTICQTCNVNYNSCVYEYTTQLNEGYIYLMDQWDKHVPPHFPYTINSTATDLQTEIDSVDNAGVHHSYTVKKYQPVTEIRDSLGQILYDYLLAGITAGTVDTVRAHWDATGSAICAHCTPPGNTTYKCSAGQMADLSKFPNILANQLDSAALFNCVPEYSDCLLQSNDYNLYICQQNLANCLAYAGSNADSLSCYAKFNCSVTTVNADSIQRRAMISDVIHRLYINPDTITYYSNQQYNSTLNLSIPDLDQYLDSYEVQQRCRLQCANYFEVAYQTWIQNKIDSAELYITNSFKTHCYSRNEKMTVSYDQSLYHYTLYNYNEAGQLISTVPPEGIDYVDIEDANPTNANRTPAHRMLTKYKTNSIGELKLAFSPDGDTTQYLYDKAGRVRFSQNKEQKVRGLASGKTVFSYTKYDVETGRISETGEYSDTLVKAFIRSGSGIFASDSVNDLSWPSYAGSNFEQNYFYYDTAMLDTTLFVAFSYEPPSRSQKNLNQRVSKVSNAHANTYYSYDAHGRVKWVVQELLDMDSVAGRFKTVDYRYLAVTSQVQQVIFQQGRAKEEFRHRYSYDTDNRLTRVEVSRDTVNWAQVADYDYYLHGPLKSTGLGDSLQHLDYVYNLQGWIKSVNHPLHSLDPGQDGTMASAYEEDVFGMVLNYYKGDYKRKAKGLDSLAAITPLPGTWVKDKGKDLFNGNISSWVTYTGFDKTSASGIPTLLGQGFRYDQLNRLVGSFAETQDDGSFSAWTSGMSSLDNVFQENLTYDANGNILSMVRTASNRVVNGTGSPVTDMDNLSYHYDQSITDYYSHAKKANNKLNYIDDAIADDLAIEDLTDQSSGNYRYDAKGRLTGDLANEIDTLKWNAYDKVVEVVRTSGSAKPHLKFTYDAFGHRVSKRVIRSTTDSTMNKVSYYAYDANMQVMAVYDKEFDNDSVFKYTLTEEHIYGSSRLGSYQNGNLVYNETDSTLTLTKMSLRFELTDHLGNVRAVISGERVSGNVDIVMLRDYYPFGSEMPGRKFTAESYRYGFNGKEKDDEMEGDGNSYDFDARMYDPRIGRWLSRDPLEADFSSTSSYSFAFNSPITMNDPTGMTGEITVDEGKKTITIRSHLVFYGSEATEEVAEACRKEIETKWNNVEGEHGHIYRDANGNFNHVGIGDRYSVKFDITKEVVTEDKVKTMAAGNTSAINNYIRIEASSPTGHSFYDGGTNTGFFVTKDNLGSSATAAHEFGHGLNLFGHHDDLVDAEGPPDIMASRSAGVKAEYTLDRSKGDSQIISTDEYGKHTYSNTVDPSKRVVTNKNINDIFDFKINWHDKSKLKGDIGIPTNRVRDKNGKITQWKKGEAFPHKQD